MTMGLPLAWLWVRWLGARASRLVVFGQASLFVYWVHVELAYGVFTHPLQHALPLGWAIAALLVFTIGL